MEAAAPIYRSRWWPEHDRQNQAWIATSRPLVAKFGDGLKEELAKVYATDWPATSIRIDVTEYANFAGGWEDLPQIPNTHSIIYAEPTGSTTALIDPFDTAIRGSAP